MPDSTTPRPASKTNQCVLIESFEAAGLTVELLVAGCDHSPRRPRLGRVGTILCAEPYASLSDGVLDAGGCGRGDRSIANDAALALLLAGPLNEQLVWVLEEHLRVTYGATVVLPLYLNEAAVSRTGVSLTTEAIGNSVSPVGVIFDGGETATEGSSEAETKTRLLHAAAQYDGYLRGDLLLAVVQDDFGVTHWTELTDDGDLDELRASAVRAADGCS